MADRIYCRDQIRRNLSLQIVWSKRILGWSGVAAVHDAFGVTLAL